MREVTFSLYGRKHKVILSMDLLQRSIGVLFVLMSAALLGVFELFKWGWDWSMLKNSVFWSGYFIKLGILLLSFFGAYVFQRSRNLNDPKIVIQKQTIKHNKKLIMNNFQTTHCEKWIANVLNYEDKLSIYKEFLEHKNSNLNLIEPREPLKNELFYKVRYIIFNEKKRKYTIGLGHRKYYEKQLELVNKHMQVIKLFKEEKFDEAKDLYKTFEKEDDFKYFMPHYKGLNFPKLFNVSMDGQHIFSNTVEYKESSTLAKKLITMVAVGCVLLAFICSIVLELSRNINYMTIIFIALNLLMVLWYVFNGIMTANKFVFGNVMSADAERIKICNKYRDDCIKNNNDWVKNFKSEIDDADQINKKSGE